MSVRDPFDWIRLCEECCQLARQALDLYCPVVKIDRKIWSVQKLIVEKTQSLFPSFSVAVDEQDNNIWGRTGKFVGNSESNIKLLHSSEQYISIRI